MPTQTAVAADELLRLPRGAVRRELVEGVLVEVEPAGFEHGDIAAEIGLRLRLLAKDSGLGRVVAAETGFRLARDPDTVRSADAAFVRADRLPPRAQWGRFLDLAPDLAVEVVSPSDRLADVRAKAREWLTAGTRAVWVVLPGDRAVEAYTASGVARREAGDVLEGGDVLPGFHVSVGDLFR